MKITEWLLKKTGILFDDYRLIKVRSWKPSTDPHGICWPTMLVDEKGHSRMTISPIWFEPLVDWWKNR